MRILVLACFVIFFGSCNPHSTSTRPSIERSSDGSGGPFTAVSTGSASVDPQRAPGISTLAFSPDGAVVATGDQTGSIRLLDAATGAVRLSVDGHASSVNRLVFSSDGRLLASASDDKSVRLVDAKSGAEKASFKGLDGRATSVAFTKDAKKLAVSFRLVEVTELEDVTPDGKRVHKRPPGPFGRVALLDVGTRKVLLRKDFDDPVNDLAFSPDASALAVGTQGGEVLLLDPSTADIRTTLSGPSEVHRLVFSKDGASVFAAAGIAVFGWRSTGATLFRHLDPGTNYVSIDASPDGAIVAVANSFAKAVVLLRASTGEVVSTIRHDPMPLSVAFSPDGKSLASAGVDGKVRFWNPATGAPR